jgi:cytochrome c-type biogenesis protein CcmH/NrfG
MENVQAPQTTQSKPSKLSYYLLIALTFLLPVSFLPSFSLPLVKVTLVSIVTLLLVAFWLFKKLKDGEVVIQKDWVTLSVGVVAALTVLSGVFSGSLQFSFMGNGLEIGTVLSVLFGLALIYLTANILRSRDRVLVFFFSFLITFFVVALFQLIRLFAGPDVLTLGAFTDATSNLIGKWNELGIYFGLTAVVALLTFEFISMSKVFKVISGLALAISLFFLGVINFSYVLYVVAAFSLVSMVYWFASNRRNLTGEEVSFWKKNKVSWPSLIVLVLSLVFIFGGNAIRTNLPQKFQIGQLEVSPSWSYTYDIAKQSLKQDPLFGTGPNDFISSWLKHKPQEVNQTIFWNVDFTYGIGLIPTYLVTNGLLGFLAWIIFLGLFLVMGVRAIFSQTKDLIGRFLLIGSFFAALYLWIFQVIYVPSQVLFTLTFVFTGVFFAAYGIERGLPAKVMSFGNDPKKNFVATLALIVGLLVSVSLVYLVGSKTVAAAYFFKGVDAINTKNDLQGGEALMKKAISLDSANDVYYRTFTDLNVAKVNAVLSQQNVKQEQIKTQFEAIFPDVLDQVQNAIRSNPQNYQNWLVLGRIYAGVLPLGFPGAYDKARDAFAKAAEISPMSPLLALENARLEALNNNPTKAKEYIGQAIQLKNNYTDAVYLLSQIEIAAGNIKGAIQSVEAAAFLTPNDPTVFFQLGFLRYSDKNYKDAVPALERAVQLSDSYSNARYFLGLSYDKVGKRTDAIAQFTKVAEFNPDNAEVASIIKNLKAGKDPFAAAVVEKPEKRKTPPVKDKSGN